MTEATEEAEHVDTCEECDETRESSYLYDVVNQFNGQVYCIDHIIECDDCGDIHSWNSDGMIRFGYNSDYRCSDCYRECDECGTIIDRHDDMCEDCSYNNRERNGIRDYGKTEVFKWYGGPLPHDEQGRDEGFYLGFELEISADDGAPGTPVHDWANEHFGHPDALDCKEDSSVNGFEIASQPMTPAYFEDVNWESFFDMLNKEYPLHGEENEGHGLHVHIGRVAFKQDDIAMAAFAYLLAQDDHLVRISRRQPTGYCRKVDKPVSDTILRSPRKQGTPQGQKIAHKHYVSGREAAINLTNGGTIEIRSFRSTRDANEFRDALRLVYVAAEYIRSLRVNHKKTVSAGALHWDEFAKWVAIHHTESFPSIAGIKSKKKSNKKVAA